MKLQLSYAIAFAVALAAAALMLSTARADTIYKRTGGATMISIEASREMLVDKRMDTQV